MDALSAARDIRTHVADQLACVLQRSSRDTLHLLLRRVLALAPFDLLLELYRGAQDALRPSLAFEEQASAPKRWTCASLAAVQPTLSGCWTQPPRFILACASDFMGMRDLFYAERASRRWWRLLREGRPQLALRSDGVRLTWTGILEALVNHRSDAYRASLRCLAFTGRMGAGGPGVEMALASFRGLEEIRLCAKKDWIMEGFSWLKHMPHLHSLHLDRCVVSDSDMLSIGAARGLRALAVDAEELTDTGIHHIRHLLDLRTLALDYATLSRTSIDAVSKFQFLESLSLHGCEGVGHHLPALAGCERLRDLWLGAAQLSDDALVHLAAFHVLEMLHVERNRALAKLSPMPYLPLLTFIDLCETSVTADAIRQLSRVLPALKHMRVDECAELSGDLSSALQPFSRLERITLGPDTAISVAALRISRPSLTIAILDPA